MKGLAKSFALLLSFAGLLGGAANANAVACNSLATGNWGTIGTWSCGHVPLAVDDVTIAAGHTVTLAAAPTPVLSLTLSGATSTLATGANILTVTGNLVINGTVSGTGSVYSNGPALTPITISGTGTFSGVRLYTSGTGGTTIPVGSNINFLGTSRLYAGNNGGGALAGSVLIVNGTITAASTVSLRAYTGTAAAPGFIVGPTGVINATGATFAVRAAAAFANNGSVTLASVTGANATTSIWTNNANSTLNVSGALMATGVLTASAAGNTVNYNGVAQTAKVTTYNNLTLSGSLAKTFLTTPTVNGVLSLEGTATVTVTTGVVTYGAAATLQYNKPAAYTATLVEWPATFNGTGGVIVKNTGVITTGANKVLSSGVPLTIDLGASLTTVASTLNVGGDLTVNGTLTGSTGAITLSGAAPRTIDGTGSITSTTGTLLITTSRTILNTANLTIARPTTLSAATTVTNNGIINKTTTAALTGANATTSIWVNAANSTLNYAGTNAPMATGVLDVSASNNTVNYNGAGQTVEPPGGATPAYYHLTLSGSAAKTMGATTILGNFTMSGAATTAPAGALAVGGNFTIGTGTTFTAGAFNHTVSGNFDATGAFTAGAGTVTLNGAAAQTISGTSPVNFNNLTVTNGANPNITLATNVTVAGTLTGTVNLTSTCPTDYTLTSTAPAQVLHSCSPVTPPANFDCVETGLTYPAARNPLYTKLAGTAFSFDVVALKADGTVETTYASTGNKNVTVELVDGSGATACASRAALTPAVSQTLTFTAADLGRKTAANMTVSKAYANLRCRVTDVATSIKGCSVDNFSVRPGAATLTTNATAAAPSPADPTFIKAGTAFTIGATTTTGATDAYTGTLALDATKLTAQLPSNGATQQSGGAVGSLAVSPAVQANASPAQNNNATWNEVGYLYAAAGAFRDDGFTSVDQVGDCVSSTVSDANLADTFDVNNQIGCSIGNKTAVSFGRFIPDHFDVTGSNGTMTAACSSGGFTYTGQAMGYGTVPSLTIKAINAATGVVVTQNYQGVFQKLAASGVSITAPAADGTQNGLDGLTKTTLTASMSAGALTNSSGTLTYALAAGDQYTYTRDANSLVGAYTSNIPLVVASVSDGEVTAGTLPTLSPTGVSLRFGRLRLSNAHGSELLNLPIPMQTQYWNGTSFVTNSADNCTSLIASNIKLTAPPAGVTPTVGGAFLAGVGSLTLSKPTTPAKVSVDLCVDLGADPGVGTVCSATSAAMSYLQGLWAPGSSYNNDPTARATFGVYKGAKEFIYLRENY